MRTLLQAFMDHFDNTSEEKVLESWSRVKEKKYGGPTVEEFFNSMNMLESFGKNSCQFEKYEVYNKITPKTSPKEGSFLYL